jgi:hypothetical protein
MARMNSFVWCDHGRARRQPDGQRQYRRGRGLPRGELEHVPKNLLNFLDQNMFQLDQNMFQLFESECFLFDQMIPSDREAL